jgi:PTH1 family peptidyl-tRNA hydrolase
MGQMKMVVGLGNPGERYIDTRHNIGFKVVDLLAKALGINVRKRSFGARLGSGEVKDKKLILLKPWRFMNRSGQVVADAVAFYKLPLDDLLVVTDDMALGPGRIRIRARGSAGGHNGLADIIDKLGDDQFARLRVGIGRSDGPQAVDYVLSAPQSDQKLLLEKTIDRAKDAVLCWMEFGVETVMNKFNSPVPANEQRTTNNEQ